MTDFLDYFKRGLLTVLSLSFYVLLTGCSGEENNQENTIEKFTLKNATIVEENSNNVAEIQVSLEGSLASDLIVPFEIVEGSATIGDDINSSSGQLTFSPDNLAATLPIEIIGDDHFELSETFLLKMTAEGRASSYTITITDDDEMAEVLSDTDGFYTPAEYPSMSLKWSDEFNGDQLDTADWTYEIGDGCDQDLCGWGNKELEEYTDSESNSRVENGMLTITARKDGGDYTSARIKTQDKVELQYGRIDVRAKLPKGQGIWPAIWMLGANIDQENVGWPASGEIDIMELVGHEPSIVHGTVHYDDGGYDSSTGIKGLSDGTFSDQFHVFTLVWEKDQISWYVDNQKFQTFSAATVNVYPFNAPFFFIMNVAVGGNWPGRPDQTTEFPQEMVVDYIRVFE